MGYNCWKANPPALPGMCLPGWAADDGSGASPRALAPGVGRKEPAIAPAAQAPRPLLPARVYGGVPMLAVARPHGHGTLCAGQSRHPDLSVAGSAAPGPAAEYRVTAA